MIKIFSKLSKIFSKLSVIFPKKIQITDRSQRIIFWLANVWNIFILLGSDYSTDDQTIVEHKENKKVQSN